MTGKPTKAKAYGSIPHLPASRLGPGDHHIDVSSAKILTETGRTSAGRKYRIVVQEKMDGSCVAIYRAPDGEVMALGSAGYLASSSPYRHVRDFADWVGGRTWDALLAGTRLVGEWVATRHGTAYVCGTPPFFAFDLMVGAARAPTSSMRDTARLLGVVPVPQVCSVLGRGVPVEEALEHGSLYAVDGIAEGYVWRAEDDAGVVMIAKWVNPGHVPAVPE